MESRWIGASVRRVEDPRLLVGASRVPRRPARRRRAARRHPAQPRTPTPASAPSTPARRSACPAWWPWPRRPASAPRTAPFRTLPGFPQTTPSPRRRARRRSPSTSACSPRSASATSASRWPRWWRPTATWPRTPCDLIEVDYEPLPVVADAQAALGAGLAAAAPGVGSNVAAHFAVTKDDPDAAFRAADAWCGRRLHRAGRRAPDGAARRARRAERRGGGLTVWSSNQAPHWLRDAIATVFGLPHERIHVVAPTVGGGFGTKSMVYPEELLVPRLALLLGRPLKWIDDRHEHFITAIQARDAAPRRRAGPRADGTILGLRDRLSRRYGGEQRRVADRPLQHRRAPAGPLPHPGLQLDCTVRVTNKAPLSSYRGAGRPEAVLAMERILDAAARALGPRSGRAAAGNTLRTDEMPTTRAPVPRRPPAGAGRRRLRGVPGAGAGRYRLLQVREEQARRERRARPWAWAWPPMCEGTGRTARARPRPRRASGQVVVTIALPAQGQGHETVTGAGVRRAARRAAGGRAWSRVTRSGVTYGGGTIASRVAWSWGTPWRRRDSARGRRRCGCRRAAEAARRRLRARREHDQRRRARPLPRSATLAAGAGVEQRTSGRPGPRTEPGRVRIPTTVTFANGVHAADGGGRSETGGVTLRRYVVVHDCGAADQSDDRRGAGGRRRGPGHRRRAARGANLRCRTASSHRQFPGLRIPEATTCPASRCTTWRRRPTRNPLGLKGVGEAGAIAVAAAVPAPSRMPSRRSARALPAVRSRPSAWRRCPNHH